MTQTTVVNALVRARHVKLETATPLGQFVEGLKQIHADEQTTMAGGVVWSAFPVEMAISQGVYPLLVGFAKKYKLRMDVRERLIDVVAPRLNRLINAGIVLAHPTIKEAAADFDRRVVKGMARAVKLGYRPGMQIPMNVWQQFLSGKTIVLTSAVRSQDVSTYGAAGQFWQGIVAAYFANLLVVVKKFREENEARLNRLKDGNTVGPAHRRLYILSPDDIRLFRMRLNDIDPTKLVTLETFVERAVKKKESKTVSSTATYTSLKQLPDHILALEKKQDILSRFPYLLGGLSDEVYGVSELLLDAGDNIDDKWLNTQVYLAALRDIETKKEFLYEVELIEARDALRKLSNHELTERFFARMEARRPGCMQRDHDWIELYICERVATVRNWKTESNRDTSPPVFLCERPEYVLLDPDRALAIATSDSMMGTLERDILTMDADLKDRFLKEQVVGNVLWADVSSGEFLSMVAFGLVPFKYLVLGLRQMDETEVSKVVDGLASSRMIMKEDVLEGLIENGFLFLTPVTWNLYARKIPVYVVEREFKSILDQYVHLERDGGQTLDPMTVLRLTNRIDPEFTQRVFEEFTPRYEMVVGLLDEVSAKNHGKHQPDDGEPQAFVEHVGTVFWEMSCLANIVDICGEEFRHQDKYDKEYRIATWEAYAEVPSDLRRFTCCDLGIKVRELRAVMQKYTEEELFCFMHEGEPDIAKNLQEHFEGKKVYLRFHNKYKK